MMREIECEECNGTGNDPGGLNPYEKTDCPACQGHGKIPVDDGGEAVEEAA